MDLQENGRSLLIGLYLERRADLIRFFTVRLRSTAAAEDLVQDIYVRLSGIEQPAEIQNPVAYLYRLGSNLMLDRLRGERRAAHCDGAWLDSQTMRIGLHEVSAEPSPETAVAARQRLALLTDALWTSVRRPSGCSGCTSSRASAIPRWRPQSASQGAPLRNT